MKPFRCKKNQFEIDKFTDFFQAVALAWVTVTERTSEEILEQLIILYHIRTPKTIWGKKIDCIT